MINSKPKYMSFLCFAPWQIVLIRVPCFRDLKEITVQDLKKHICICKL